MNNYRTETSEDRTADYCECDGRRFEQNPNGSCGHIEIERAKRGYDFDLGLAIRYLVRKKRKNNNLKKGGHNDIHV